MSKRTEAIPIERQTNDPSLRGRWLLSFLDRNLSKFSRWVRNTIGLTVLALLVVVLLHGSIAPTYVEGRLFIGDTETEPPQLAKGYFLTLSGGGEFLTNDNGCWMLPVRGFFPHKVRVDLLDSGKKRLDKFAFWAPSRPAPKGDGASDSAKRGIHRSANSVERNSDHSLPRACACADPASSERLRLPPPAKSTAF